MIALAAIPLVLESSAGAIPGLLLFSSFDGKKTKDARLAMNKASSAFTNSETKSEYIEIQILRASIQKCRKGRIAPALSAVEMNSGQLDAQLNAELAAEASQTSDRESEERQCRAAIRNSRSRLAQRETTGSFRRSDGEVEVLRLPRPETERNAYLRVASLYIASNIRGRGVCVRCTSRIVSLARYARISPRRHVIELDRPIQQREINMLNAEPVPFVTSTIKRSPVP